MSCRSIYNKIKASMSKCWDNYTWFSRVAMHGDVPPPNRNRQEMNNK